MELKPCPFCGSKAKEVISETVKCSNSDCPMSQYILHKFFWNGRDDSVLREMEEKYRREVVAWKLVTAIADTGSATLRAELSRLKAEYRGELVELTKVVLYQFTETGNSQDVEDIVAAFLSRKDKGEQI